MANLKHLAKKLVGDYGDDVIKLANNDSFDDIYSAVNTRGLGFFNQNPLKQISDSYGSGVSNMFPDANLMDTASGVTDALKKAHYAKLGVNLPSNATTTNTLGSVRSALGFPSQLPHVDTPDLPTLDLVSESMYIPSVLGEPPFGDYYETLVRPHNNTALGRWFREQMAKKV
jgi:hypothetical protein